MPEPPDEELRVLWAAARKLVDRGELDGAVALSYVVWPTPAMEQASSVGQAADEAGSDSQYAAWKT